MMILKLLLNNENDMQDVYENTEKHNPGKKHKLLIVFGNIIADMIRNKELNLVVTELN